VGRCRIQMAAGRSLRLRPTGGAYSVGTSLPSPTA
jgi:hypothetical protein